MLVRCCSTLLSFQWQLIVDRHYWKIRLAWYDYNFVFIFSLKCLFSAWLTYIRSVSRIFYVTAHFIIDGFGHQPNACTSWPMYYHFILSIFFISGPTHIDSNKCTDWPSPQLVFLQRPTLRFKINHWQDSFHYLPIWVEFSWVWRNSLS